MDIIFGTSLINISFWWPGKSFASPTSAWFNFNAQNQDKLKFQFSMIFGNLQHMTIQ